MHTLMNPLKGYQEFQNIRKAIQAASTPISISGCIEGQKCHLMYGAGEGYQQKVVIAASEIQARKLAEEYRSYERESYYFPSKDWLFYEADIHGNTIEQERLHVLKKLMAGNPVTIFLTMDALMDRLVPMEELKKHHYHVERYAKMDPVEMASNLVSMGYEKVISVENPGEFAIRGGIFDVYPMTEECPYRMELWGDEIDSIRSFDVESQRGIEELDEFWICPATEVVLTKEIIEKGLAKMEKEQKSYAAALKKAMKTEEYARSNREMKRVKEELEDMGSLLGADAYLPYFYEDTVSLLDYFIPGEALFFMDEPNRVYEHVEAVVGEFRYSMECRLESGYILPGQVERIYSLEEMMGQLEKQPLLLMSMLIQNYDFVSAKESFYLDTRGIRSYNSSFQELVEDLKKFKKDKYRILLFSPSVTRAKRLADDIREAGLEGAYRENLDRDLLEGEILITAGKLQHGFEYPTLRFVVISESDVFHAKKSKKKSKKSSSTDIAKGFRNLSIGDYVVHETHGIGIYRGIEKIEVDKIEKDYIDIEYGGNSHLYIQASQLDKIQKYASATAKKPKISKLGGNEWKNTKKRVRSNIHDIAKELVELYAIRQSEQGFACDEDTVWQTEFEEMFPYDETDDQLTAIAETKKDMESTKIMDRLICGDVGFGKTEVAIRAAFKAVNNSKQVVYLVPTTILAQQHYNSFVERMKDYPIKVEMLSRFRTPAQQKKAIAGLKNGSVDIVIGTHRLLSKDLAYKDLGLLIIDEEQRFGVAHKEKIKQMCKQIDVLSLSATPIPRTLHMSMIGIRDMSLLEEAPVDRRAIQTYVLEFNEEMIREAIRRELNRNGQVYYVYNRVQGIDEVAAMVQKLVPEAVVDYAHGQMGERTLENKMYQFMKGETDVLVATTIIETGLDISNANTMIIDQAERLGLSQLYQLRGRVGRSNRTSYAFLMYRRNGLKEQAEKRLEAIREFTDLGSGFKIAMRDLEIRGAGNLLGEDQSGHMEAVGYDLYCKMLNDAVLRLKGESMEEEAYETTIELPINAFIPASYIKNEFQKLEFYKRISEIREIEEKEELVDELIDRFGDMPKAVENLLEIAMLRANAHKAYITSLEQKGEQVTIKFYAEARLNGEKIPELLKKYRNYLKIKAGTEPVMTINLKNKKKKEYLPFIIDVIEDIKNLIE